MWIIFHELCTSLSVYIPIYPPPLLPSYCLIQLQPEIDVPLQHPSTQLARWQHVTNCSARPFFYDFPTLPMQRIMRGSTRYLAIHWWTTFACQRPLSCLLFLRSFFVFLAFRQFYTKSANFSPKFIHCSQGRLTEIQKIIRFDIIR